MSHVLVLFTLLAMPSARSIDEVSLLSSSARLRRHGIVTSFCLSQAHSHPRSKFFHPMSSSSLSHSFYFLHVCLLYCSFHLGMATTTSTRKAGHSIDASTQGLYNSYFSNQSSHESSKNHGNPSGVHSIAESHGNGTSVTAHVPVLKSSSIPVSIE